MIFLAVLVTIFYATVEKKLLTINQKRFFRILGYMMHGLFIIPYGNNNVDNWNEEYVKLWGTGIRIYANKYTGNLNGNYKLGTDETIAVYENGSAYGSASKGGYTGTVNLNYLLPSEFDNNNTSTVIR